MEKFTTSIKKTTAKIKNDEIVYENDFMKVINYKDWTFVEESDRIVVLPYVKDEGFVFLRAEVIPTWNYKYKNTDLGKSSHFLTVISGTIENNETPEKTLRRELYEEAGIVLNQFYNFDITGPFFESKGNLSQFYICLMELNYSDYKLVAPTGDGSIDEKKSKTLRVSIADLDEIRINDMASKLLINMLKKDYNL